MLLEISSFTVVNVKRNDNQGEIMRFRGWDWQELGEHFGVDLGERYNDATKLREYLEEQSRQFRMTTSDMSLRWKAPHVQACKRFLKMVYKADTHTYWPPVWEGLLKVKNAETFMAAFLALIERMGS